MKSSNLIWFNITLQNDLSNQVIRLHGFQLTNSKGVSFSAFQDCPEIIHGIMMDCWQSDPSKRPKFGEIVNRLDKIIRSPEVLEILPLLQSTLETWVNKLPRLQNHTFLFLSPWKKRQQQQQKKQLITTLKLHRSHGLFKQSLGPHGNYFGGNFLRL